MQRINSTITAEIIEHLEKGKPIAFGNKVAKPQDSKHAQNYDKNNIHVCGGECKKQ
ncbi:MAG: hypothetical protein OCC45_04050 [Desulfotalea sp.]